MSLPLLSLPPPGPLALGFLTAVQLGAAAALFVVRRTLPASNADVRRGLGWLIPGFVASAIVTAGQIPSRDLIERVLGIWTHQSPGHLAGISVVASTCFLLGALALAWRDLGGSESESSGKGSWVVAVVVGSWLALLFVASHRPFWFVPFAEEVFLGARIAVLVVVAWRLLRLPHLGLLWVLALVGVVALGAVRVANSAFSTDAAVVYRQLNAQAGPLGFDPSGFADDIADGVGERGLVRLLQRYGVEGLAQVYSNDWREGMKQVLAGADDGPDRGALPRSMQRDTVETMSLLASLAMLILACAPVALAFGLRSKPAAESPPEDVAVA